MTISIDHGPIRRLIIGIIAMMRSADTIRGLPQSKREKHRKSFGDLGHFLPQDDRELKRFYRVSITAGIVDAKFFGVIAMFGAIVAMALAPWLDTSSVRSGRYRPMFKWWFWLLVVDFFALM